MAAKKRNKKQTLEEFKAWLEGVEEISGSDWTPSKEQWKMIRERINNIKDPEPREVQVVQAPQAVIPQSSLPVPTTGPHPATTAARQPRPVQPQGDVLPVIPDVPSSFDKAGIPSGVTGETPPPAGIPPTSALARPGPDGVPKSPPPKDGPPGSSFE